MAVVPSNPDRFSRLVPYSTSADVSMVNILTIPQLAIASRMQEYKDLLGAGGSRYSDWLETFFASKIEHVDRPKLLFSASQTVNVQIVMNEAGVNNFTSNSIPLGQQGGSIAFNTQLGRRQSYYFREPGYLIDMLSIRPVYYWTGVLPDYAHYKGADYFNPIYNDIGFQDVPFNTLGYSDTSASLVCSLVRFRCRVAQQTEGYAGRLCHCRILDIGHGTGHHVHFPLAGIRPRLVRLSLRQHSHDYLERHRSIGRARRPADTVFRAVSPSHHLRGFRPGVCSLARYSGAGIRICTDDVHCADHRGMPAHGGHRAGYFTAHRSADDRQLVLAPVPPHHLAFHRHPTAYARRPGRNRPGKSAQLPGLSAENALPADGRWWSCCCWTALRA